MTDDEFRRQFRQLQVAHDLEGLRNLLDQNPPLQFSTKTLSSLMHKAAKSGCTPAIALLVARGVDINIPEDESVPDRPIGSASILGQWETVRWLLEHGAEVNYGWGADLPHSRVLISAIALGNLEIVRLLVEAGAFLDVVGRMNISPLSSAIAGKHKEIEAYLRSKGAVESHLARGYRAPDADGPVVAHVEREIGKPGRLSWVRPTPGEPKLNIWGVYYSDGSCLFTDGMSSRPMTVPKGGEQFQRAELAMKLFCWDARKKDLQANEHVWIVNWLLKLTRWPFEHNTWLGDKPSVIPNGEPPQPLSEFTQMTCWLLLPGKDPLVSVELPKGQRAVFYTVMPIHTAERDFLQKHGAVALMQKFADLDVPDALVADRPSVV